MEHQTDKKSKTKNKVIPGLRQSRCCFHCKHGRYPNGMDALFMTGYYCTLFSEEVEPVMDCPSFYWYSALQDGEKMKTIDGRVYTGEPFVIVKDAAKITGASERMVSRQLIDNSYIGIMVKGKWRIPVRNLHLIKPTKICKGER